MTRLYLPLSLLLAALVMLVNIQLAGESSISSLDYLRYDLSGLTPERADARWIDRWLWTDESPYKYRLLGRLPLGPATDLLTLFTADREQAFYLAFTGWSLLLLWVFFYLFARYTEKILRAVCADNAGVPVTALGLASLLLVASAPPVLFLFKYPVHGSPNDILGYLLMTVALTCLLERRVLACCLISTLAVTCRETTLLVPFVLLFFTELPLRQRLPAAGIPVAALLLYRLAWPGGYDPFAGALHNFSMPLESLGFLVLAFGALWLPGTLGWLQLRATAATFIRPLTRSFPWSVLLVLAIVLLTARVREIRIIFILCLYVVPFAVLFLYNSRHAAVGLFRRRLFPLYLLAVAVLGFRLWTLFMPGDAADHARLAEWLGVLYTGYPLTPQYNWVGILCTHLVILLLLAPLALPRSGAGRPAERCPV